MGTGEARGVGGHGGPRACWDAELDEEAGDVALGGADADEERRGNLAIGLAGHEEAEDFLLPGR